MGCGASSAAAAAPSASEAPTERPESPDARVARAEGLCKAWPWEASDTNKVDVEMWVREFRKSFPDAEPEVEAVLQRYQRVFNDTHDGELFGEIVFDGKKPEEAASCLQSQDDLVMNSVVKILAHEGYVIHMMKCHGLLREKELKKSPQHREPAVNAWRQALKRENPLLGVVQDLTGDGWALVESVQGRRLWWPYNVLIPLANWPEDSDTPEAFIKPEDADELTGFRCYRAAKPKKNAIALAPLRAWCVEHKDDEEERGEKVQELMKYLSFAG